MVNFSMTLYCQATHSYCIEYLGSISLNSTALRYGSKRRIILVNFFHEWDYDGDVARSAKSDDYSLNNGTQSLESDWTFLSFKVFIYECATHSSMCVFSYLDLSIGDWVLCKRGLDGDNFYLKFLFNFRKRKLYVF